MPTLSVIIPVYNVEKYIEECICSIVEQTFNDIEIIVVDDGSTDNSSEIVDKLSTSDLRIKVVHQKNMGLPGARNTGLEIATGEYVGFIDSDDRIKPNMYELLINSIKQNNSELAVCNFYRFDKKQIFENKRYKDGMIQINNENVTDYYSLAIDSCCNKIFKTDIIKSYGIKFEDKSIVPQEDFYFLMKYLANTKKVSMISQQLYEYRIRKSSITNSRQPEGFIYGCLRFVKLTKDYHLQRKIYRNLKQVEFTFFIKMLQSAINNSYSTNFKDIKKIIMIFAKDPLFNDAISYYLKKDYRNFKDMYNYLIYSLYKNGIFTIASILESLRIKRLSKVKININSYD